MIVRAYRDAQELAKKHGAEVTSEHVRYAVERIAAKRAFDKATDTGDSKALAELGKRHGLLKELRYSPRGTYRGGGKPVRVTRATIEAHDHAQAVSDEIRLVLGPWTADGRLPEHRRVPESSTVAEWRRQLQNGNGSAPPDVRKIIASIEKLRASLPAGSPDRAALTKALEALGEVT